MEVYPGDGSIIQSSAANPQYFTHHVVNEQKVWCLFFRVHSFLSQKIAADLLRSLLKSPKNLTSKGQNISGVFQVRMRLAHKSARTHRKRLRVQPKKGAPQIQA